MWVSVHRLPACDLNDDNVDVREDLELEGQLIWFLDEEESASLGLSIDPRLEEALDHNRERELRRSNPDEYRTKLRERGDARDKQFAKAWKIWKPRFDSKMEVAQSEIFLALTHGRLTAFGKRLQLFPGRDDEWEERKIPLTQIPTEFWIARSIDWHRSRAKGANSRYYAIRCATDQVLTLFPGKGWQEIEGVKRIGSLYLVEDTPLNVDAEPKKQRGRPPKFDWDAFHVEVAALVKGGDLHNKQDSALKHFQLWFQKNCGQVPADSVIKAKLKPYYDRFVRPR